MKSLRLFGAFLAVGFAAGSSAVGCQVIAGLSELDVTDLGTSCFSDDDCDSEYCTDGVCCEVEDCLECKRCNIEGKAGKCATEVGAACGNSSDECREPGACNADAQCVAAFVPAGAPCSGALDNDCTDPDTCDGKGNCNPNNEVEGVACGDSKASQCDGPDTCDGEGNCNPQFFDMGTACGSQSSNACNDKDSCDGKGKCLENLKLSGTECGSECEGDVLYPKGECDGAGTCNSVGASCSPNACIDATSSCGTMCDSANDCASDAICDSMMNKCISCGTVPPNQTCSGAPCLSGCAASTCAGATCECPCDAGNPCDGTIDVGPMTGPGRVVCSGVGQCDNVTVDCGSPNLCEVVCTNGACTNLKLLCAQGPCKLTCESGACSSGVVVSCSDNDCQVTCDADQPITQNCASSCGCGKLGCR